MHSKPTLVIILVLVVAVAAWYFVTTSDMRAPAPVVTTSRPSAQVQTPAAPVSITRLQSVTPLATSTASVSGVDMTVFTAQANQSAQWSSQDGTNDAQSTADDGTAMNTALDQQGNTVQ